MSVADLKETWIGSSRRFKQTITQYRVHLKNLRDKEIPPRPPYPQFGIVLTQTQKSCVLFFENHIRGTLSEEESNLTKPNLT